MKVTPEHLERSKTVIGQFEGQWYWHEDRNPIRRGRFDLEIHGPYATEHGARKAAALATFKLVEGGTWN